MGQLASKIRAKYAGEYDDFSDDELEFRVLAKYPEYRDMVDPKVLEKQGPPAPKFIGNATQAEPTPNPRAIPGMQPSTDSRGRIKQIWDYANEPTVDIRSSNPTLKRATDQFAQEHPVLGGAANFGLDMLSSLTSPLSIVLGGTAGAAGLAEKLGYEGLAAGLELPARAAGAGMVGQGMYNVATGETLPERLGGALEATLGVFGARTPEKLNIKPTEVPITKRTIGPNESIDPVADVRAGINERLALPPASSIQLPEGDVLNPKVNLGTGKPAELLKPNLLSPMSEIEPKYPTLAQTASQVDPKLATNPTINRIDKVVAESGSPEIAKAVSDPVFVKKYVEPVFRTNYLSRFLAKSASSDLTELAKADETLGRTWEIMRRDSKVQGGTWRTEAEKAVEDLTKKQRDEVLAGVMEGKTKVDLLVEPELFRAKAALDRLDKQVVDTAIKSKIELKASDGTRIPFKGHQGGYWPHKFPEGYFDNIDVVKAKMLAAGKSVEEVDKMFENAKQFGDRLIDAQHTREIDAPGYRTDFNTYLEHLDEMADKVKQAEYLGPRDTADPTSPISNLIAQSKNPKYTGQIVKKLLNRGSYGDPDANVFTRKVVALEAWMHLSTSAIGNLATIPNIWLQTNNKSFRIALADIVKQSTANREFANAAGATDNILRQIVASQMEGHSFGPTKYYGLDAEERVMRTASAVGGKAYAEQLFKEAKDAMAAGQNVNPYNLKRLQDLTLEPTTKLLSQPKLTDWQIKRAAFRTAEISQGLADPAALPHYWTGSSLANILTLFHKYQFAQTKIVKDALMRDVFTKGAKNLSTIPKLIAISQIAGELTGDAKSLLYGGVRAVASGDPDKIPEQVANRGQFIQDKTGLDWLSARVIQNAADSYVLGVWSDLLEMILSRTGADALNHEMGSTIGDIGKGIGVLQDVSRGNFGNAGTTLVGTLPVVGPPLRQELK